MNQQIRALRNEASTQMERILSILVDSDISRTEHQLFAMAGIIVSADTVLTAAERVSAGKRPPLALVPGKGIATSVNGDFIVSLDIGVDCAGHVGEMLSKATLVGVTLETVTADGTISVRTADDSGAAERLIEAASMFLSTVNEELQKITTLESQSSSQ